MGRVAKEDTGRLLAITLARQELQDAVRQARQKLNGFIEAETAEYHEKVISAVRLAIVEGHSARQIGQAYGSSDPATIRSLVEQAGVIKDEIVGRLSAKTVTPHDDGTFTLAVVNFGDDQQSGSARFEIDSDGQNISVIEGDYWLQSVAYREGIVEEVIRDARR